MAQAVLDQPVLTAADGMPLRVALRRAERRKRLTAFALVTPLLVFILITFAAPILDMVLRSVHDPVVSEILPKTGKALDPWKGEAPPDEQILSVFVAELARAYDDKSIGKVAARLNYEVPGAHSLIMKTARRADRLKDEPLGAALMKIDKDWGNPDVWGALKRLSSPYTLSFYLAALDMQYDSRGEIVAQPEDRQIYGILFMRTLWVSLAITGICLLLAFPIAYLMAILPTRTSNLLMIMVLLPFWTSLLVRTTSWIVLLQTEGVLNDIMVWTGLIGNDQRLQMIYNMTGTIIAMVHILLPFMVLPLFSVMKTISPSYMRAAESLGATPTRAFWRIYFPLTVPGIGAGSLLVFILAIGYYITPALVGGRTGQLISNFIAFHMQKSLNWGLAAALAGLLLAGVLALYWLYNRLVGIDNMKLG
jgi:putative spermidine/putrescine transport system permease protein